MKILFLHPNMPGQYKHLCQAYAKDPKNQVVFITKREDLDFPGVHRLTYKVARDAAPSTHRYMIGAERAVLQGQEVWRMCQRLKNEEGFVPDVICAHPGWGDALYVKDVYPDAPLLSFFEFYYHSKGADVGFNTAEPLPEDDKARVRTKNIINLLSLESADWGITPTQWQFQVHPEEFKYKISVLHDGVDTDVCAPNQDVTITLPGNVTLKKGDEVVTYVTRNFEHYRGFPTFVKAAKLITERRPNCHIIAVGADDVSYGRRPPAGKTFRQMYLEETPLDLSRVHFVGPLPYHHFLKVVQLSSAHIYLTYPFVLSWSMLEAMSTEALVIGSSTQPVMEVIRDGHNGLLVDFFSPEQVADRVDQVFAHKDRMQDLRRAARQTILDRYALKKLLPLHMNLINDLAAGQKPPRAAKAIEALYQEKEVSHGRPQEKQASFA